MLETCEASKQLLVQVNPVSSDFCLVLRVMESELPFVSEKMTLLKCT